MKHFITPETKRAIYWKFHDIWWTFYYKLDDFVTFVTKKRLYHWKYFFKNFAEDVFIFLTPWLRYCHKTLRLANQNFEKCLSWGWFSTSSRSRKDYSYLYVNFNIFGYMTIKTMKYYHNGEQTSLFLTGMVGMMKALNVQEEKRDVVLEDLYKNDEYKYTTIFKGFCFRRKTFRKIQKIFFDLPEFSWDCGNYVVIDNCRSIKNLIEHPRRKTWVSAKYEPGYIEGDLERYHAGLPTKAENFKEGTKKQPNADQRKKMIYDYLEEIVVEVYQQAYADALKMKYFNQYDEKYKDIVELAEKTAKEFLKV